MTKHFLSTIGFCLLMLMVSAKEGMWIPTLLAKYNIEEMNQMGFKLTAKDIYSVNHASLKDAVVLFGSGCTGELISGDGLLITNHHCGFSSIQARSTVEKDYLTNGFWAMNRKEELANPGLSVQFLVRMEDVTEQMLANITDKLSTDERGAQLAKNAEGVKKKYLGDTSYKADIKPLFNGNQYFIYIYEVFTDIRLVGAPPISIGKFGGDTDNWVWPRHTGDFSLFRIYANKENKPAAYSPDNVPYKPRKFFSINIKGIKEGDFTMVFGYPGTTQRYIPSQAVDLIMNQSDPTKVAIRTQKLNLWAGRMEKDPKIRLQYANKYVSASNSWKKWQGEVRGLKRLNGVEVKRQGETEFVQWVNQSASRKEKYGRLIDRFDSLYKEIKPYQQAYDLNAECIQRGSDIFLLAAKMESLESATSPVKLSSEKESIRKYLVDYLTNYDKPTDQLVWIDLMKYYLNHIDPKFLPEEVLGQLESLKKNERLAMLYDRSILSDTVKIRLLAGDPSQKNLNKLRKDPVWRLYKVIQEHYSALVETPYIDLLNQIAVVQKKYTAALIDMNQGKRLMADANLTLRVAYGRIEGYQPADGIYFRPETTLKGIIEKDNPDIYDYRVDEKLKKLYREHDFGIYKNTQGEVPVAFCASNHTTGGNSGSPVLNGNGELIGVNFDRCWEGTMSDILFDPDQCRNIALDIRYALFVIDKFAGAGYLLNEMEIIR